MCGTTLTGSKKKTGYVKPKGYKAIGFSVWDSDNLIVSAAGEVAVMPITMPVFRFEVKNTADNFTETGDKDMTTMTGQKTGVATFALMYCDRVANIADAQALLDGTWNVFFESNETDKIKVAGTINGGDIITVVESTDAQGFLFTLSTVEAAFSPSLSSSAVTEYRALISAVV